ncbi:MAG: guanylate kinase [Bacteroidales bacterium]
MDDFSGKLIIFSAPSGSGKTTIVRHLLSQGLPLAFSVSATSRAPRGTEKHGREYYFLSPDEFRKYIEQNAFVEWEEVYADRYYGTLKSEVERLWSEGKHVLFDVDVVGGVNLKKQFGDRALSIFVKAPSIDVLEERLRKRSTETEAELKLRVEKADQEYNYARQFDVVLVNDDLQHAQKQAVELVCSFLDISE